MVTITTVIVYHVGRLYRRATDLERLVEIVEVSGAQVHTVAAGDVDLGTASGRMVARMLGAPAQHESERMGERIKMKISELAASGHPPGGRAPFGYSWGTVDGRRTYVINPTEAAALATMARRVLEGASLLAVSRELHAAGVSTREGRPWHHSAVRAALVNPAIAGLRVHRREIAGPGEWPAVMDRATWEETRAVLADPARKRTRPARRYLLAGMVTNANGDPMNGRPEGDDARRTYATRWPASSSAQIPADALEKYVIDSVLLALDKSKLPEVNSQPSGAADIAAVETEMAELAKLRGEGVIGLAEWMAARRPLQERLEAARRAAGTSRRPSPSVKLLSEPGAVRKVWPSLSFSERREIVRAVVDRVVVGPAPRRRWTTLEERMDPNQGFGITWRV